MYYFAPSYRLGSSASLSYIFFFLFFLSCFRIFISIVFMNLLWSILFFSIFNFFILFHLIFFFSVCLYLPFPIFVWYWYSISIYLFFFLCLFLIIFSVDLSLFTFAFISFHQIGLKFWLYIYLFELVYSFCYQSFCFFLLTFPWTLINSLCTFIVIPWVFFKTPFIIYSFLFCVMFYCYVGSFCLLSPRASYVSVDIYSLHITIPLIPIIKSVVYFLFLPWCVSQVVRLLRCLEVTVLEPFHQSLYPTHRRQSSVASLFYSYSCFYHLDVIPLAFLTIFPLPSLLHHYLFPLLFQINCPGTISFPLL